MDFRNFHVILSILPIMLIPLLIILKIIIKNKIFDIVFYILMFFSVVYLSITVSVYMYSVLSVSGENTTLFQKINNVGPLLDIIFLFFNILAVFLFVTLLILTFCFRKNEIYFKRFNRAIFSLLGMFIFTFPTAIAYFPASKPHNDSAMAYKSAAQKYELASNLSILTPLKCYYAHQTGFYYLSYIREKYDYVSKFPDYSSADAQKYIDKYFHYASIAAELENYNNYLLIVLNSIAFERYDETRKAVDKLYKYDKEYAVEWDIKLNILEKNYNKALELLNNNKIERSDYYYAFIYIELGDYKKARYYINKFYETSKKYIKYKKLYLFLELKLNYKMGNEKIAKQAYKLLKSNNLKNYTIEEIIRFYNIRV